MLDLRLLRDRLFRYLQHVRVDLDGQLPRADVRDAAVPPVAARPGCLDSGLTTFPQAFGIMISSLVAGRIYRRIGRGDDHRRLFAAVFTIPLFFPIGLDTSPVDHPRL